MPQLLLPALSFRARSRRLYAVGTGFFWLLLLAAAYPAQAQCPNDDLENRRLLRLEETVASSTTGCTVQRQKNLERFSSQEIWLPRPQPPRPVPRQKLRVRQFPPPRRQPQRLPVEPPQQRYYHDLLYRGTPELTHTATHTATGVQVKYALTYW